MSDQYKPTSGEQVEGLLKQLDPSGRENEAETDRRRKLVGAALAAEREKCQPLVDALTKLVDGDFEQDVRNIADDALAQWKEKQ